MENKKNTNGTVGDTDKKTLNNSPFNGITNTVNVNSNDSLFKDSPFGQDWDKEKGLGAEYVQVKNK